MLHRGFYLRALTAGGLLAAALVGSAAAGADRADAIGQQVRVPSLRCLTEVESLRTLARAGLDGELIAGKQGVVLSQSPPAGDLVTAATAVFYTLQPRRHKLFEVRDVRHLEVSAGRKALTHACLLTDLSTGDRDGSVLSQDPSPGVFVDAGTPVTLVSSLTSASVGSGSHSTGDTVPGGSSSASRRAGLGLLGTPLVLAFLVLTAGIVGWYGLVRPRRQVSAVVDQGTFESRVDSDVVDELPVALPGPEFEPSAPAFTWELRRDSARTSIEETP